MKKTSIIITAALLATSPVFSQEKEETAWLKKATSENLTTNILPFWSNNTVDPNGGFYGMVKDKGNAVPESEKGAILNARILWTYSRAYREYAKEEYKQMADRAAEYYINYFIDKQYGGVYWSVDAQGNPKDMTKQTYPAAFGIYGLAEHYWATGDSRSLEAAKSIYNTIETKVHDKARKGYIETFLRDYSPASIKGVDGKGGATKTMNTHIHILEAYTTLYQVWPDAGLKANLVELIGILQNKLYSPQSKHLILYCDSNWNTIGEVDSYGHDIETSWLLTEAAEAIGDPQILADIRKQAVEMVDVALKEGITPEGAMIYEKEGNVYNRKLSWWPQCETVIGCINAWQITGKEQYFQAAVKTWKYIDKYF